MSKLEKALIKRTPAEHSTVVPARVAPTKITPMSSKEEELSNLVDEFLLVEKELKDRKIIYQKMKEKSVVDAFRDLRTSIFQKQKQKISCGVVNFGCL